MKKNRILLLAFMFIMFISMYIDIVGADITEKSVKLTKLTKLTSTELGLVKLEYARTQQEQSYGLMNRQSLCSGCAMLFIYNQPVLGSFWMKNTYISLDIIFIDADGKIVALHQKTEPLNANKLYNSDKYYKYVLETNAGFAKNNNLTVNSYIDIAELLNKFH